MTDLTPTTLVAIALLIAGTAAIWTALLAFLAYRMGLSAGYRQSRDLEPPALPKLPGGKAYTYDNLNLDHLTPDNPQGVGADI